MSEHLKLVAPFGETETAAVPRRKEVMIRRHAGFTYKQSTATNELVVTVHPDIEILVRLVAGECHMHAFDYAPAFCRRKQQRPQKNLGEGRFIADPRDIRSKENDGGLRHLDAAAPEKRKPSGH